MKGMEGLRLRPLLVRLVRREGRMPLVLLELPPEERREVTLERVSLRRFSGRRGAKVIWKKGFSDAKASASELGMVVSKG